MRRILASALLVSSCASVFVVSACSDLSTPVAPDEPKSVADARVYSGAAADSVLRVFAGRLVAAGDSSALDAVRKWESAVRSVVGRSQVSSQLGEMPGGPRGAATMEADDSPTPETRPNAIIYSTGTMMLDNSGSSAGLSALIMSRTIYYGNMAKTTLTYGAYADSNRAIVPSKTITNIGKGAHYSQCLAGAWTCAWTWQHQTAVLVSGPWTTSCHIDVRAQADHEAWWEAPIIGPLGENWSKWGNAFVSEAEVSDTLQRCVAECIDDWSSQLVAWSEIDWGIMGPQIQNPPANIVYSCRAPMGIDYDPYHWQKPRIGYADHYGVADVAMYEAGYATSPLWRGLALVPAHPVTD